jgi:outer membrane protein OmpA-like peptidoglycan-associated protein
VFVLAAMAVWPRSAVAQPVRSIEITRDQAPVRLNYGRDEVVMTAERGTLFDVIHTEGDRFAHRAANWYWVLLPRDAWGTQRAGWISGRHVEVRSRSETQTRMGITVETDASPSGARVDAAPPDATPAPTAPETEAAPSELVLNFEFAKSELTPDAAQKLAGALGQWKAGTPVSLALEGHADAVGSDAFNRQLGLARAEAVKRALTEQLHVPADHIGVISYGEMQPTDTNSTDEGRARNRRVVIRIGR